jgi:DNA-binding transcriptional ArsR family regulator
MLKQYETRDPVFQALADGNRRRMLEQLSRGPASVSELAEPLEMSLPGVVQHLHVLEASGLVHSKKVGRVRTCRIDLAALQSAEDWLSERRAAWELRLDRLDAYLADESSASVQSDEQKPNEGAMQ